MRRSLTTWYQGKAYAKKGMVENQGVTAKLGYGTSAALGEESTVVGETPAGLSVGSSLVA